MDVQIAGRGHISLARDPGDRAPSVAVRRVHLAQRCRDDLDVRIVAHDAIDHPEEGARIECRRCRDLGSRDPEPLLEVFFVADEHIDVPNDPPQHRERARVPATGSVPELLTVVQVERHHGAAHLGRLHRFDDQLRRRFGQRREDPTAVKPPHARAEDRGPVEIARLELCCGLVGSVVKDDGAPDAVAAVAVHRRHVRPPGAVVREVLVERRHPHRPHALGDQIADGIVDDGAGDRGPHLEAVGQVRCTVELAAAHVDGALGRLSERHVAWIEPMHERAKRQEIECAVRTDRECLAHRVQRYAAILPAVKKREDLPRRNFRF